VGPKIEEKLILGGECLVSLNVVDHLPEAVLGQPFEAYPVGEWLPFEIKQVRIRRLLPVGEV
jgi:hypothetical protein